MRVVGFGKHPALVGGYNLGGEFADYDRTRNGGFDTDTLWTKSHAAWTISGGTASCDGSQPAIESINQDMGLVIGKKFRTTFTVLNRSAGNVRPYAGNGTPGTYRGVDGTYIEDLICAGNSLGYIACDANFVGDVDNVSFQELYTPDMSGRANHGTVNGATATPWGYSFNGTSDFIDLQNPADLQITSDITVMAWVKGVAQGGGATVISKYDSTAVERSWLMYADPTNTDKLQAILSSDGGSVNVKAYISSLVAFDDISHYVGFTFHAASSTFKIYVDGVWDVNVTKSSDIAITALHNSVANALIGARRPITGETGFFAGTIGRTLIIPQVLTRREILEEMQRSRQHLILAA